eukprot:CAMPEP_0196806254 /NCGR_PEP_ID=MMETSP1362-20130617/6141_1 /TAXON_ID=163516 /ORGANISM="Leptocylindrus danicus, Strain CCMP1856" /LENGTH=559 /DNA_ID=CAMNT_0042179647 /DNA_START=241 /DNA_END=1920 /DNA_ORIENTATION=+
MYQNKISPTTLVTTTRSASQFDITNRLFSQSCFSTSSMIRKERTRLQAIIDLDFDDEEDPETIVPKVYPQRWVQLGYLSLLALVSDWVCFSTAAAPSTFESAFGHSSAGLIDMFLFTNVFSCFLVTDIVAKVGLGRAIKGASVLMGLGCLLRSGIPLFMNDGLVPYEILVAGTVMVGAAQPFFQCTPPMLSATWFASDERATSTATAINFNQIGIATAFLIGGNMATDSVGLQHYFELITVLSGVLAAGTVLQFQDKPPTPPSSSEIEKLLKGEEEPPFFESVKKFFKTPGFTKPLIAFICSISITNIVGAFIDEVLERGGIVDQFQIDLAGAGFELAILIGGIVIGGYVDRTKKYKKVTLACLLATVFFVVPLGLTDHALGQEPILLVLSLLGLGMAAGPVQPINAELAVDVTYPSDETAVESVQQIGGNLISALLVPVAELMTKQDYQLLSFNTLLASDIRGDVVLLTLIALVTMVYYSGFDAPLKRTIADCSDDGVCSAPELNMKMNANGDLILDASNGSVNGNDDADSVVSVDIAKSLREATKKVQEEVEVKADK